MNIASRIEKYLLVVAVILVIVIFLLSWGSDLLSRLLLLLWLVLLGSDCLGQWLLKNCQNLLVRDFLVGLVFANVVSRRCGKTDDTVLGDSYALSAITLNTATHSGQTYPQSPAVDRLESYPCLQRLRIVGRRCLAHTRRYRPCQLARPQVVAD